MNQGGQAGSSTRGLIAGGSSASAPAEVEKIQYVTISTLGNSVDFGDSLIKMDILTQVLQVAREHYLLVVVISVLHL